MLEYVGAAWNKSQAAPKLAIQAAFISHNSSKHSRSWGRKPHQSFQYSSAIILMWFKAVQAAGSLKSCIAMLRHALLSDIPCKKNQDAYKTYQLFKNIN